MTNELTRARNAALEEARRVAVGAETTYCAAVAIKALKTEEPLDDEVLLTKLLSGGAE